MTTYLEIVNKLVRRVNEVEVLEDQFASVIGVQAFIKDGIIDTLDMIFQHKYKWPFLAVQQTQVLTIGDQQYPWPTDFLSVDWNSFQVLKDPALGINDKALKPIQREEWYSLYRDQDFDAGSDGRNIPQFVFSDHGFGWGLTPSPDKAYTINYKYFKNPVRPVLATDVIALPQEYEYLLMHGGLQLAYLFYDNNERSEISKKNKEEGFADMVNTLLGNNMEHMYDGRVPPKKNA